mgnify:CR=1 FL=1
MAWASDLFAILWTGSELVGLERVGPRAGARGRPRASPAEPRCTNAAGRRSRSLARYPAGARCRNASARCRSPICSSRRSATRATAFSCRRSSPKNGRWPCRYMPRDLGWLRAFHAARPRAASRASASRVAAMAATLEKIARTDGEAFYRGELAEAMVAHAQSRTAPRTRSTISAAHYDRLGHAARARLPRHTVHEIPPNGQGIAALMALGILRALRSGRDAARFSARRSTCRSRR